MKNLIIANWKMNPVSLVEAKKLFNSIKKIKSKGVEVVICPPFIFIEALAHLPKRSFSVGGQNVFWENEGAFTGEVSPVMLKDLGVEYVIIGHSERRIYLKEIDAEINKKTKKSLENGLKVILCIGETKAEWEAHAKPEVLETQVTQALLGVTKDEMKNVIIAYEPVWAIGTGNNCMVDEAMTSIMFVRKVLTELYTREIATNTKIIYGGSVKSINSADYIKSSGANGLLVGGASLNVEEFTEIIKSVN
jgi:triosephosphate isomerase